MHLNKAHLVLLSNHNLSFFTLLTKQEAQNYSEQLHPAFAGYLHDGIVSERDSVAVIMHLIQKGYVTAVWEDNSMTKNIKSIMRSNKLPALEFDQLLMNVIFSRKSEVKARDIKNLIKDNVISKTILLNLSAIETFPIINNEVQFDHGDDVMIPFLHNNRIVDTLHETRAFDIDLKFMLFLLTLVSVLFLVITNDYIDIPQAIMGVRPIEVDAITIAFLSSIFAFSMLYISFRTAKKEVNYRFVNEIVPIAQKKYAELYDFLTAYPLENHNIVNEFLGYSIAFGIDGSWLEDFGLQREPKIDGSPMIDAQQKTT